MNLFVGRRGRRAERFVDYSFFLSSQQRQKVSSFGSISQKEWILGFKIILRKAIRSINKLNQREREYLSLSCCLHWPRKFRSLSFSLSFCFLFLSSSFVQRSVFFLLFVDFSFGQNRCFSCCCQLNYFSFPNLLPEMEIAFTNAERFFSKFL